MSNKKPNILYLFCDQLRYDALSVNGNKIVKTPNMEKIAEMGAVFDNSISSCPICSPYRAQLITGRYSHKNGVMCNEYKLRDNQVTIHQALKKAGYHTAHIGKWHLGRGPYTEEKRYGLDYMFANNINHDHHLGGHYFENEEPVQKKGWTPEIETSRSIEWIEEHLTAHPDTPFSLFLGYGPPHNNYQSLVDTGRHYGGYPDSLNTYDQEKIKLSPNVGLPFVAHAKQEMADYYANVTGIDAQIGRFLTFLKKNKILDNTIICLSSDHGDHVRSHGYGGPSEKFLHSSKRANKATPHEEAVHIPFIMSYPEKVKDGQRTDVIINSVDVMPTLLTLCDISIPDGVQGQDVSFAVTGKKGNKPDSAYMQILGEGWPHRGKWVGQWRAVRNERYTYARWYEPEKYDQGIWLYDRVSDPYEMNNLAGSTEYKEIQDRLEKRLKKWMKDTDDPFDTGERDPKTNILKLGDKLIDHWN